VRVGERELVDGRDRLRPQVVELRHRDQRVGVGLGAGERVDGELVGDVLLPARECEVQLGQQGVAALVEVDLASALEKLRVDVRVGGAVGAQRDALARGQFVAQGDRRVLRRLERVGVLALLRDEGDVLRQVHRLLHPRGEVFEEPGILQEVSLGLVLRCRRRRVVHDDVASGRCPARGASSPRVARGARSRGHGDLVATGRMVA